MNDLQKYFEQNKKRRIAKWVHYFDVYDRHFSRFRGKDVVILEIGVAHGGSLQMWKEYFGPNARIYGLDINPKCKEFEEENVQIFIGSQSDRALLREIKNSIPPIDILIDDGGHMMVQQIVTYEELFDHVKDNGVYLCEDLHTSYWLEFGGGHKRQGSFIEYSKNFIDSLNAYHSEQSSLAVNKFTESVDSIHYYDSILVIEKKRRNKPHEEITGVKSFDFIPRHEPKMKRALKNAAIVGLKATNRVLRFFRLPGFIIR